MTTEAVFDDRAAGYDDVAQSDLGIELRQRVHSVVRDLVGPGDTVADLGCGTGIDAAWLASQVSSVVAFDESSEMVRIARDRCSDDPNVSVMQADIADLVLDERVDLVLANFGVINCVGDLGVFGSRLTDMLKPGGTAVLVTMACWCPIELGIALVTANKALLVRRRNGAAADYRGLDVRYASARDLADALGSGFELSHAESLGLLLPPYEQRRWVQDRAWLRGVLGRADQRLGRIGARLGLGDHHIAVLRQLQ